MNEHPDITREFAAAHYDDLLQDAERMRQIRAFETTGKHTSLLNGLLHSIHQLAGASLPYPREKSDVCISTFGEGHHV